MASENHPQPLEQADRSGLYGQLVRFLMVSATLVVVMIAARVFIPVPLPHIQLPAETWTVRAIPGFFIPMTNTTLAVLVSDFIILVIAWRVHGKVVQKGDGPSPVERAPEGLQNFVEAIIEFWEDQSIQVIGERLTRRWLPLVITIFGLVWVVNWSELVPGYDSIGVAFPPVHAVDVEGAPGQDADTDAIGEEDTHAPPADAAPDLDRAGTGPGSLGWLLGIPDDGAQHTYFKVDGTLGPIKFLSCRSEETAGCAGVDDERSGFVPFLRVASSDLNFTLALALISFMAIQIAGLRELGPSYMTKFFNFKEGVLGVFVGLLELVSEISRIISFAFRLFGNMFAGQVLIFVIMFLVPLFAVVPVYGLELFVGLIQAYVFAVLTLAFIGQAIISHGHDH